MIEWSQLTNEEIVALDRRLPDILPLGLIEAHGPHLAVSVDTDTATYFALRVAENTKAILLPTVHYGFADEMREYVGTLGVSFETMSQVLADLAGMLCFHGFKNQIWLSGHGANSVPAEYALHKVWREWPDLHACYWNYWTVAGLTGISHADKGETGIAAAVGTRFYSERARDFHVEKPWYRIRSRAALQPDSGGVNGQPTLASIEEGNAAREKIVEALTAKVQAIIQQESGA